jgi:hypothetical protein
MGCCPIQLQLLIASLVLIAGLVLIVDLGTSISDSAAFSDSGIDAWPTVSPHGPDCEGGQATVSILIAKN